MSTFLCNDTFIVQRCLCSFVVCCLNAAVNVMNAGTLRRADTSLLEAKLADSCCFHNRIVNICSFLARDICLKTTVAEIRKKKICTHTNKSNNWKIMVLTLIQRGSLNRFPACDTCHNPVWRLKLLQRFEIFYCVHWNAAEIFCWDGCLDPYSVTVVISLNMLL